MKFELFKQRLSEELKECKMTQKEIAKILKIDQANISNYIRGKQIPKIDIFADICELLDLNANYILGLADYSGKKSTI